MAKHKLEVSADPAQPIVRSARTFDAPAKLVYDAKTKPELLRRWWGPRKFVMTECTVDARVGGAYRFGLRAPDGSETGFHGIWKEMTPIERLVCTWVWEGMPHLESLITDTFREHGGQTTVRTEHRFPSMEARDGYLASGAEQGMAETFERLDELLASQQAT